MAAIWSVNPNDGVEGGNGSFIFPRNESEQDKTYTVTYSDGDKVCSKTVVVMARSIDCCNEITVNEPSDMIPANGITATTAITTFTSTCGFDGITVRGSNGLTVSTNNGTIYIDSCDENEDDGRIGRSYDLPFIQFVDGAGNMTADTPYEGVFVKKADPMIPGVSRLHLPILKTLAAGIARENET